MLVLSRVVTVRAVMGARKGNKALQEDRRCGSTTPSTLPPIAWASSSHGKLAHVTKSGRSSPAGPPVSSWLLYGVALLVGDVHLGGPTVDAS